MRQFTRFLAGTLVMVALVTGCSQAAPVPTPAPTKAAEPAKPVAITAPAAPAATTAPVAAPTAAPTKAAEAPAQKSSYPEKGKTITLIVPWAAGGVTDVGARLLAAGMEKDLGVPVQVVNKAGAASQVGLTEMAKSKPDGYTIALANKPADLVCYLDPERKSAFGRQDLVPVAMHVVDPAAIAVKASSPYKDLKDLVEAGKKADGKLPVVDTGILSQGHFGILDLQRATGAKFANTHLDGAPALTALLGGHVEANFSALGNFPVPLKSGEIRLLGVGSTKESPFAPGVKTYEAQGFKMASLDASRGIVAPKGTPKEAIDVLAASMKRVMADPQHQKQMADMYLPLQYMGPEEFAAYWDSYEKVVVDLMKLPRE